MRIICLHRAGLNQLLRLGAQIRDLTPSGIADSGYHLAAVSPDQLLALKELAIEHEDITPQALANASHAAAKADFLYCRGGRIPNGTRLRASYKSQDFIAEVRGGIIWLDGKGYHNPSDAARGVGYGSVNGWRVWEFLDSQTGKWQPLDVLRGNVRQ